MTHLDLSGSNFKGNVSLEIAHLSNLVSFSLVVFPGDENITIGAEIFKAFALNLTKLEALALPGVGMSDVPLSFMANLSSSLTYLDLSGCELQGKFPETFFLLPRLEFLYLKGNNLNGKIIWPALNYIQNLTVLDLSDNNFTGQIPEVYANFSQNTSLFLSSLTFLDLSHNSFEDVIPSWIFNLPLLTILGLSNNHFNGTLFEFNVSSLRHLSLAGNKLHGQIPSSIFQNVRLNHLNLSSNNFSGFIELENLSKLKELIYLSLSSNKFSFSSDTAIQSLSWESLVTLDLRSNSFSGPLPIFSAPQLNFFSVMKNHFSGEISVSICNFTSLKLLDLSHNSLTGKIPECMGSFSQNLLLLNLQKNRLQGSIPRVFSKKNTLRNLNLNGNELQGPLPRSLLNCKSLEVLDLGNNLLNDTFPNYLESLPELRILILRDNKFHGSIGTPKSKQPFLKLRIIDLSNNDFSGALPSKYFEGFTAMINAEKSEMAYMGDSHHQDTMMVTIKGAFVEYLKILTFLTAIDFSSNKFSGKIPNSIGKLKSLTGLNLSHNVLNGTIPQSLGALTNLEWLDLSSNQLTGKIPSELLDITSLASLNLSRNNLVGPIPQGKQFNTFGNDSFLGNSGLCGSPLTEKCDDHETNSGPSRPNPEQEDSSINIMKIVSMGFASGFVIGISIGYILLYSDGRLSWLCKRIEQELKQKIRA